MKSPEEFQQMMIDTKATKLLEQDKVKFEGKFDHNVRFRVLPLTDKNHEHLVFLDVRTKEWHCDCKYSALHPDKDCAQIRACMEFLNRLNGTEAQTNEEKV